MRSGIAARHGDCQLNSPEASSRGCRAELPVPPALTVRLVGVVGRA